MSEDFDKEAEREKLEEKYERDKEKRQATEQMSELLLQGATMTNAHCSECSDPIFRYDGQEFCPTCEKPVDRAESGEEGEADSEDDSDDIQVTTPSDDARVSFGEGRQASGNAQDGEQQTAEQSAEQQRNQPAGVAEQRSSEDPRRISTDQPQDQQSEPKQGQPAHSNTGASQQTRPSRTAQSPSGTGAGEGSVAAARESLIQTLTRFSQQAAATEDPNRAQEHLAAAREAAEALAALRQ